MLSSTSWRLDSKAIYIYTMHNACCVVYAGHKVLSNSTSWRLGSKAMPCTMHAVYTTVYAGHEVLY